GDSSACGGSIWPARRPLSRPGSSNSFKWCLPAPSTMRFRGREPQCIRRTASRGPKVAVMATCDVLIVGGGPAGSSCAWQLRAAGLQVVILDRKPFPRDKTCAGWITPAVLDELQIDGDDYRRGRVFEPITAFSTGIIGGSDVITHYDQPI